VKLTKISEGGNEYDVSVPTSSDSIPRKSDDSFFNTYQELNRDISVLVLRSYAKKLLKLLKKILIDYLPILKKNYLSLILNLQIS